MRRSSVVPFCISLGMSLFGLVVFLPLAAHAQFFGPIISTVCNCDPVGGITANGVTVAYSAPAWGCILATLQNLMTFLASFATVIITIFIAWAGFTYMTSGSNPEKRSLANKRIMNAVIGLVIVLCAYILVDSLMKVIYDPGTSVAKFGPWNSILAGDGATPCLAPIANAGALPGVTAATNPSSAGVVNPQSTAAAGGTGTGACNASTVQTAAATGGVQMSSAEAATLACIAGPESGCGALNKNYNWDGAKSTPPSTAWGPFQITLKGNAPCLNNSACEAAAGVSGPLNCNQAFNSQGYSIPGTLLTECQTAAANLACSAVAANCIVQKTGGYTAWTGNNDSTAAHQACVANNSGS